MRQLDLLDTTLGGTDYNSESSQGMKTKRLVRPVLGSSVKTLGRLTCSRPEGSVPTAVQDWLGQCTRRIDRLA